MNNYRPISVISAVAKIFEKAIYGQLYEYLNENSLLSNCQSGFCSLYSTLTALIEATNDWSINIDRGNLNGVVFIDLKKAFDTIDHEIILRKLTCYGFDIHTLKWFESYLSNRYQKCNVNGHLSNPLPVTCGVPQGSIIVCLLFLIYINDLPSCLSVGSPRMFADDTNITFVAGTTSELESLINIELQNLNQWLQANRLSLNIAKTEFMIISSRQKQLTNANNHINIKIENNCIKRVASAKSLGVTVGECFSWDKHVDEKSKKLVAAIGALKRVRPFISTVSATLIIYQALIQPHFDYCSSVWDGCSAKLSNKMQKLQNRAARIITKSNYDSSATQLLESLHWDDLSKRRKKHKAFLICKILNGLAPQYLRNIFTNRATSYTLRDNEAKLNFPKPRTNYLKRAICYDGASLWNSLPLDIRCSSSLGEFRSKINKLF